MRIHRGTSLIEFIAAFAIISTGLMAIMGLALANRKLSQANVDRLVATNMSREGIELILQMRDSNWLAGVPFDGGLLTPTDGAHATTTFIWSGGSLQAAPIMDFTAEDFTSDNTEIVQVGPGPYFFANRNDAAGITGTATQYKRLMRITALCDEGVMPYKEAPDRVCVLGTKVGIRAKSIVRWTRNDTESEAVMYNDFYDWR